MKSFLVQVTLRDGARLAPHIMESETFEDLTKYLRERYPRCKIRADTIVDPADLMQHSPDPTGTCKTCKVIFKRMSSNQKFCSRACRSKWYRLRTPPGPKMCKGCKVEFLPSHHSQLYCKPECRPKYYQSVRGDFGTANCAICGVEFKKTQRRHMYCGKPCQDKAMNIRRRKAYRGRN